MFNVNNPKIARIYNESSAGTQSGKGKKNIYILEFMSPEAKYREPLMGWSGSRSTMEEIKMKFPSLESAKRFAEKNNLQCEICLGNSAKLAIKRYSDNFK